MKFSWICNLVAKLFLLQNQIIKLIIRMNFFNIGNFPENYWFKQSFILNYTIVKTRLLALRLIWDISILHRTYVFHLITLSETQSQWAMVAMDTFFFLFFSFIFLKYFQGEEKSSKILVRYIVPFGGIYFSILPLPLLLEGYIAF